MKRFQPSLLTALKLWDFEEKEPVLLGTITHLTIESPLTAIEYKAFIGRRNLVSLILPETIETVGEFAFEGCHSLESFQLPPKIKVISKSALGNCRSLSSITIPESVEVIEPYAFNYCRNLREVNFLGKEPDIQESVFLGCESLANGDGLVIMGTTVYDYFGNAKKITIPDGIKKISSLGIRYQKFHEVILPDSLEYIGEYCFSGNQKLTTVSMGNGVKTIGSYAFQDSANLNPFKMSTSLEELGNAAFGGARKLNDDQNFKVIGGFLTGYSGEEVEIVIPEGVTTIVSYAFSDRNIKKVTLPSTLKVIKIHAFYSCKRLSEIIFSENLKEIEDEAFIKCTKLKEIQFPEGVKLGKELFEYEKG